MLDNIKQELAKNKEMKESIKKFRDEARKLEESDALQEARRKYVSPFASSLPQWARCLSEPGFSWSQTVRGAQCGCDGEERFCGVSAR